MQKCSRKERAYLKVKTDGRLTPLFVAFQWSDSDLSTHHEFHVSLKLFDAPHYCVKLWFIFGFAGTCRVYFHVCRVGRDGYLGYDIRSEVRSFKYCFYFNTVLEFVEFWVFLDNRDNLEWQVNVLWDTVGHQLKDTIRWNESNTAISIKAAQSHTLVKLNVINLYPAILLGWIRILD